jgi:hypothetical protein
MRETSVTVAPLILLSGYVDATTVTNLEISPGTPIQIDILSYIDELIDGLSDTINHIDSPSIEVLTFPGRPPPKIEVHWSRATMDAEFSERVPALHVTITLERHRLWRHSAINAVR